MGPFVGKPAVLVVAELDFFLPPVRLVAPGTLCAELFFVPVLVAGDALPDLAGVDPLRLMALPALKRGVLALEDKAGKVVLELLLFYVYEAGVLALVLGVAGYAGVLEARVHALVPLYALGELIVAIEALRVRYAAPHGVA